MSTSPVPEVIRQAFLRARDMEASIAEANEFINQMSKSEKSS